MVDDGKDTGDRLSDRVAIWSVDVGEDFPESFVGILSFSIPASCMHRIVGSSS